MIRWIFVFIVLIVGWIGYNYYYNELDSKTNFRGLPITIEYRKGDTKSGTGVFGNNWKKTMLHDYGYFDGIMGADGKELDFYMNPDAISDKIFRVKQLNVLTKEFDEYKIMIGFMTMEHAKQGYLTYYPEDWAGYGGVEEITLEEIK